MAAVVVPGAVVVLGAVVDVVVNGAAVVGEAPVVDDEVVVVGEDTDGVLFVADPGAVPLAPGLLEILIF